MSNRNGQFRQLIYSGEKVIYDETTYGGLTRYYDEYNNFFEVGYYYNSGISATITDFPGYSPNPEYINVDGTTIEAHYSLEYKTIIRPGNGKLVVDHAGSEYYGFMDGTDLKNYSINQKKVSEKEYQAFVNIFAKDTESIVYFDQDSNMIGTSIPNHGKQSSVKILEQMDNNLLLLESAVERLDVTQDAKLQEEGLEQEVIVPAESKEDKVVDDSGISNTALIIIIVLALVGLVGCAVLWFRKK